MSSSTQWKPFWTSDPVVQKMGDDCYSDIFQDRDPESLSYIELKECLELANNLKYQELRPYSPGQAGCDTTHKVSVYQTIATLLRKRLREFRSEDGCKIQAFKANECDCCVKLWMKGYVVPCPGVRVDPLTHLTSIGGPCHSEVMTQDGRLNIMTCLDSLRNEGNNPCALCKNCYIAYKPHLFPLDRRFGSPK